MAAPTTGSFCEDAWKKVCELSSGESREKTKRQVNETGEVEVILWGKKPLSSSGSLGGEVWIRQKHLQVGGKQTHRKGWSEGQQESRGALYLKGPTRITPEVEIFPFGVTNHGYSGWIKGTCHVNRSVLSKEQICLLR